MKIQLAFLFCLCAKALSQASASASATASSVAMTLKPKTSLADALATASAQATSFSAAPSIAVADATASASASSLINSRKTLLPSYSSIKSDIDKKIADAKARMEQRRKEIFGKTYGSKLSCWDLKDDMCYAVEDYEYCGYCVTEKYPYVKGHGVEYYEEQVAGKKGYETVIKLKGECKGEFVYAADYCPSCEKALQCLIVCSDIDIKKAEKKGVLEIKESCFKECGVKESDLVTCGYVEPPKPPAKKTPVVYHPAPVKVHPAPVKVHPAPVKTHPAPVKVHPAPAQAFASASATAIAGRP